MIHKLQNSYARRVFFFVGVFFMIIGVKDAQLVVVSKGRLSLASYSSFGFKSTKTMASVSDVVDIRMETMAEPTDIYPAVYDLHVVLEKQRIVMPNWRGREKVSLVIDRIRHKKDLCCVNIQYLFISLFGLVVCLLTIVVDLDKQR